MADIDKAEKPKTLKDKLWNVAKTFLKIAVTGVLLYYIFHKIDIAKIKTLLHEANLVWIFAALICFFISTLVSSWRLLTFIRSIDLHLDWRFNLRLYLLGMFYNLFLPGGIGGDGYKIWLLNKRYKIPAKKVFWVLLFDRLSGFWAIGLITVVLVIFLPQMGVHVAIPGSIFVVGSIVYYFVAHKFFKEYTRNFFTGHAKAIGVQALQVCTILLVMLSLHHDEKFAPYLFAFLTSSLAAVVPFTFGGLGMREYIFKYTIAEFHMNQELAVFLSLSFYVISAIVSLLGVYYVFNTSKLEEGLPPMDEQISDENRA